MTRRLAVWLSPLLLLALYPLSSFIFLGDIRPWLLPLALAGILYLQAVRLARSTAVRRTPAAAALRDAGERFLSLPPRAAAVRLFWAALLLYTMLLSGAVAPPQPFTGDEPHYLLISESLVSDGDINLANDHAEQRQLAFYGGPLRPHAWPGREGSGFIYSQHFPGISALAAPFYALGRLTHNRPVLVAAARFPVAILSALLASVFFLFIANLVRARSAALLGWALFAAASPFVYFSALVYSEIPPALISLLVLSALVVRKKMTAPMLVLCGTGIGVMPWFGIKYLVLAAGVFLAAAASVALESKNRVGDLLRLGLSSAPPLALLAYFLRSLYGAVSPVVVYRGAPGAVIPISNFFTSGWADIADHFFGLVLDQRTGIFVWGPILLLSLPGAVLLLRSRRRLGWLLLAPLAVWWGFAASVHSWGSFCPPGRPLLPVLPIFAGLAAVALAETAGSARRAIRAVLIAAAVLITLAGLRNPRLLYHDNLAKPDSPQGTYSLLLASAANPVFDAARLVPSLSNRNPKERRRAPVLIWLIAIALLTLVWLRAPAKPSPPPRPVAAHAAGAVSLSLLILAFVFFRADLDEARAADVPGGRIYLQKGGSFDLEGDGFWTKGRAAATAVVRTSSPARRITVRLSSGAAGAVEVAVGPRRGAVRLESGNGLRASWAVDAPVGIRLGKDRYLYSVRVRAERGFLPSAAGAGGGRVLGAFARVRVALR